MATFEQNTLSPGPAGAGQTWNFSGLPAGGTSSASIISPAGTAAAADFPLATKVFRFGNDSIEFLRYYRSNAQQTEDLGNATIFTPPIAPPMISKNTDTRIDARFPLSFGQSYDDSYGSQRVFELNGQVFSRSYTSGKLNMKYGAYGTLTTPAGTFTDCIRMRLYDQVSDSTVYESVPIPPVVNKSRRTVYLWFHLSAQQIPVRFQLEQDTSLVDGLPVPRVSGYYSQTATALQPLATTTAWQITPNPARDYFEVTKVNALKNNFVRLFSASGKEWICPLTGGRADIREIPPGLYLVMPENAGDAAVRLLKQ